MIYLDAGVPLGARRRHRGRLVWRAAAAARRTAGRAGEGRQGGWWPRGQWLTRRWASRRAGRVIGHAGHNKCAYYTCT